MLIVHCAEVIVGVNKYKLETEEPVDVLSIDNSKVIETQVRRGIELYIHVGNQLHMYMYVYCLSVSLSLSLSFVHNLVSTDQ